jgi:hypothetical protein
MRMRIQPPPPPPPPAAAGAVSRRRPPPAARRQPPPAARRRRRPPSPAAAARRPPPPPISSFSANGSRQTFLTRFSRSVSSKKKHGATRAYFKSCDRAIIKLKNTNLSNYKKHLVLSKTHLSEFPLPKKTNAPETRPELVFFNFIIARSQLLKYALVAPCFFF